MRDLQNIGKTRLKDNVIQRVVFVFSSFDLLKMHGVGSTDD